MKNNLINKFILIFSIFLFLLFSFCNNSFCADYTTKTRFNEITSDSDEFINTVKNYYNYLSNNNVDVSTINNFFVGRDKFIFMTSDSVVEDSFAIHCKNCILIYFDYTTLELTSFEVKSSVRELFYPYEVCHSTFDYQGSSSDCKFAKTLEFNSVNLGNSNVEDDKGDEKEGFLQFIWDAICEIPKVLGEILQSILDGILSLLDWFNPLSNNFILKKLWEFLKIIISYINPLDDNFLGKKIIELLEDLLKFLFLPSNERLSAIQNTVMSKFNFVESIKTAINSFKDIINNLGNAPVIHLDLASTKYTNAMKINVIDLNWYKPYKQYGDVVITGLFYGFYLFRLFSRLPSIVNGVGSGASDVMNISNYSGGGKK